MLKCSMLQSTRQYASPATRGQCARYARASHDTFRLWREHPRSVLRDVQTILEPDAELAIDGDRRLVAEAHAGLDPGRVALHEVRPLVAIESDPVAGAVRQAGHLVTRAEAGAGDHLPRGRVDGFARRADLRRGEGRA